MSIRFQRPNFVVSDLDRALEFYRDVLGFDVAFVAESDADSYSYDVFEIPRDKAMRWATLSAPGQERVMALTEVPGIEPVGAPKRAAIVLDIADIDGVLKRAHEGGFNVHREEVLITHDNRRGREIGLNDADGHLVVIYHIPPSNPDGAS